MSKVEVTVGVGDHFAGPAELAEIRKANHLKPTEADFRGKKGYYRKYNSDGSYKWGYKYKPNDGGKPTKEGAMVLDMLRPGMKADAERNEKAQAAIPRVRLKDQDGGIHYVEASQADAVARSTGRSHDWRAGGVRVERGLDGMLFRLIAGKWEPTGQLQLGFRGQQCPRRGMQRDPDGNVWAWKSRAWRLKG